MFETFTLEFKIENYINLKPHKIEFNDCTHTNEPGCSILEAIKIGELLQERYDSYVKLKNESMYNTDTENYLKVKKEKFKEISKYNKNNKKIR